MCVLYLCNFHSGRFFLMVRSVQWACVSTLRLMNDYWRRYLLQVVACVIGRIHGLHVNSWF